jgi:hypothetical protein
VNSIRPTTFVEAPKAAAATFAVACLAVIALGVTQAIAASASAKSAALLRAAELAPRGPQRDAALAEAQLAIADAIAVAPKDAALHARRARAFYLQAATATLPEVSPALLDAADAAVRDARAASPDEAGAPATGALVALARNGFVPDAAMAEAVAQSYAARARDPETALWRVQAAAAAWPILPAGEKLKAVDETCALLAAPGVRARAATAAARIGEDLVCGEMRP